MFILDVGNTGLKWAYLRRGKLVKGGRFNYTSQILDESLEKQWKSLPRPRRAVICNVGSVATGAVIKEWMLRHWKVRAHFIQSAASGFGVTNAYLEPQRLGADRWAALVATRRKFKGPAIIIDCGTAITIDVISREGNHLGGLIIPGMTMMRNALVSGTDGIVLKSTQPEAVSLLARDTEGAVSGGVLYAAVAVIDRVVADVTAVIGPGAVCILTGGDALVLMPLLGHDFVHEPDLVLEGVALIAAEKS